MVFKNLLRRKFRTFMFIIGICTVLTGMQVLLGITNGLDSQIESQFKRDNLDIIAVEANSVMVFSSRIPESVLQTVSQEPGVVKVHPGMLQLIQTPTFPMLVMYGLEPARFQVYRALEGSFPAADDEVMVGKNIRSQFGASTGESVELMGKKLRVSGYFESGVDTEDGALLMTYSGLQTFMEREGFASSFGIQVERGTDPEALIERLSAKVPTVTFTTAREYTRTQQNIEFIKGIGTGVGALSIVGGAIIVFIFTLIIVQERIKEIALLRAIGWRRSRIIRMILGETLVLSFLGALLSLGVSSLILFGMRNTPQIASMLPVQFTWESVTVTFAVTLVLGFTGGLASAWKASNLNPLEAFGRE